MKGDFTRLSFDPVQHRRRVYTQQGRVAVDADANESVDIAEYLREAGVRDVVGPAGGPLSGAGFAITAAAGDLKIGAGHYWVDGLLVENESATTSLASQPYLAPAVVGDGVYVVYLETWERLVTAIEDDSLREPALGGPDTTARTQQVWQVRVLRAGDVGTPFTCSSNLAAWNTLIAPPAVTLGARSAVSAAPPNDCTVPASAGYRGTENQLYRVEIHDPGAAGAATFVWSRENGSVEQRWTARDANNLTVAAQPLGFAPNDWVELIDETRELTGQPGTLVQLTDVSGDTLVIDPATATGTVDLAQFPRNPRVRRWDSPGPVKVTSGGWLALELGVEVQFSGGTYRTGQWWAVPARTLLGDVIWPAGAALPPFGDQHHFARLAVAQRSGGAWTVLGDCRPLFPPLTGLEALFTLGGDGQEAAPVGGALVPLGAPLRVGVANGRTPVVGASVRFSVVAPGAGQVNGASTVVVATGADGVASAAWSIDSAHATQTVSAQLLDDAGNPVHLPVQFDASLSTATEVGYDPKNCVKLAGKMTVQAAIDTLCATGGDGCATVVVTPGDNWPAGLLALPDGAHAHVCFRPGVYTTAAPVVIANKGSLIFSGAGAGSLVQAPKSEVALWFRDCDEVVIRDLAIEADALGSGEGVTGALTIEGSRTVAVEHVALRCAAGAARQGACLTVRGSAKTKPSVVRVRDCDLTVGHMQVGVLVLDSLSTSITGTSVQVAPFPQALTFAALLADPVRRGVLARQLFGSPVANAGAAVAGRGFDTHLTAGGLTIAFDSPVPQTEWQALAGRNPPTAAQLQTKAGLQQWAAGLAVKAVASPALLPTFARHVDTLQRQLGDAFKQTIATDSGKALLNASLIVGTVVVLDPVAPRAPGNRVIPAGNGSVSFDSTITEADWRVLTAAAQLPAAATPAALKVQMAALARRAVGDAALRAKVPALVTWFNALAARNFPAASQGVVIGGARADSVTVSGNELAGVSQAVHVGVSARSSSLLSAGRVEISGNRALLRVPFEYPRAPSGIFAGNVTHARITDNEVRLDPAAAAGLPAAAVLEGVRLWGAFGPLVRVSDNLLANCDTGVRIAPGPSLQRFRWDASGNVAPDARVGVNAPTTVTRSNNVP